jgi:hypothetical protein
MEIQRLVARRHDVVDGMVRHHACRVIRWIDIMRLDRVAPVVADADE